MNFRFQSSTTKVCNVVGVSVLSADNDRAQRDSCKATNSVPCGETPLSSPRADSARVGRVRLQTCKAYATLRHLSADALSQARRRVLRARVAGETLTRDVCPAASGHRFRSLIRDLSHEYSVARSVTELVLFARVIKHAQKTPILAVRSGQSKQGTALGSCARMRA